MLDPGPELINPDPKHFQSRQLIAHSPILSIMVTSCIIIARLAFPQIVLICDTMRLR
jgi:hypothetical protein